MKFIKNNPILWAILGVLILALVLFVIIGNSRGVMVNKVYPAGGAVAGPWGAVGIDFGQAMDKERTQRALTINPAVNGSFNWDGNSLWLVPTRPLAPGVTYNAILNTDATGMDGRKLSKTLTWKFSIRAASLVYMSPALIGSEIWRYDPGSQVPKQLTVTNNAVQDYAVSRNGEAITYSASNSQGGIDIWVMDRDGNHPKKLVDCGMDQCRMPAWSPGEDRIAYSRETRGGNSNNPLSSPRLWTAKLSSGQTTTLLSDASIDGEFPSWSPDGNHLAFYDEAHQSIHVLTLKNSQDSQIPSQHDDLVAWSPDGSRFMFANVQSDGAQSYLAIYQMDLRTHQVSQPFKDLFSGVDASLPVWSPDGNWVVVGLRSLQGGESRQLWLIGLNGQPPVQVTVDQSFTFAGYQWDSQGNQIVYQRYELGRSDSQPEVYIWNRGTGQSQRIAGNAALAEWLP